MYLLENQETEFYRNEQEFKRFQRDYIKEIPYWQRRELIWCMLRFLTVVFATLMFSCHRKIIYAAQMT